MNDPILPLPGLSPAGGKPVVVKFDGGLLSSEGGVLAFREIERRLGVADRLAGCVVDPRAPEKVAHRLADIIRFRMLMIAAGYETATTPRVFAATRVQDGDGSDALGGRAMLAIDDLAAGESAGRSGAVAAGPGADRSLLRLFSGGAKRIILDLDDTFDRVHGGQQLRLFNAYYDEYGFQPIVVFDGEGRFVTAVLRPAKRPGGREIRGFLRRLLARSGPLGPGPKPVARRQPLFRPEFSTGVGPTGWTGCSAWPRLGVAAACRGAGGWREGRFGAAPRAARSAVSRNSTTAHRAGAGSSASSPGSRRAQLIPYLPLDRHQSCRRPPRRSFTRGSIARAGRPRTTSRRGRTTSPPTALPATKAEANQFRLFLHAGAYWLLWPRCAASMPKGSTWRVMQFDTLPAAPDQDRRPRRRAENPDRDPSAVVQPPSSLNSFRLALDRLPRLVT